MCSFIWAVFVICRCAPLVRMIVATKDAPFSDDERSIKQTTT